MSRHQGDVVYIYIYLYEKQPSLLVEYSSNTNLYNYYNSVHSVIDINACVCIPKDVNNYIYQRFCSLSFLLLSAKI